MFIMINRQGFFNLQDNDEIIIYQYKSNRYDLIYEFLLQISNVHNLNGNKMTLTGVGSQKWFSVQGCSPSLRITK